MAPRPYRLGRRQAATEQTRAKILEAAARLLTGPAGAFTLDAVAKEADVARMTVYYQFQSKAGLLEALLDSLAIVQGREQIVAAMRQPDALAALDGLVAAFVGFWIQDRAVHRRLQALAELDPELDAVVAARQERMLRAARTIAERAGAADLEAVAPRLAALLGFQFFDAVAGEAPDAAAIATYLRQLARTTLGVRS
jgi:AcrR family transcriptional regulator